MQSQTDIQNKSILIAVSSDLPIVDNDKQTKNDASAQGLSSPLVLIIK